MKTVSLVSIGSNQLDLTHFARTLNGLQNQFKFEDAGQIANIGPPTVHAQLYEFKKLFAILTAKSCPSDYVIGITHERVTEGDITQRELDYFSLGDFSRTAVVTTAMASFAPSRTVEQYLAYLIIAELLMLCARNNIMHVETRSCMFDDCENRDVFHFGIEEGTICPQCRGRLFEYNVDKAMVAAAEHIHQWCKRRPLRSTIAAVIQNPMFSLSLGVAGGWFASVYFKPVDSIWILVATVLVISGVFIFERSKK